MPEQSTKRKPRKVAKQAPLEDDFGHLQPQDIKMEQAILGSLMIEKEAYDRVSEILKPAVFYNNSHQLIFEAIRDLEAEEKPVDFLTVTEKLDRKGQLEDIGGAFYITQLSSMVSSTAHLEYYAHIIAQKATARELIAYASDIQQKAFDATTDVDELMQEAEGALFQLSQENLKKDYTQINPVVDEAYEMLKKAAARSDGLSGLSSGFKKLDEITSGWQNSDLVFSLDMSNVQLVNRIIVNVCEIMGDKIRSGQLAPYEWAQLDNRIKKLHDAPLFVDDTPSLSVFELRTKARRLVREHGIKLIMIDYLQLMNASGMSYGSRQEEVSTISRSLKGLAKELNIPIIALSQLNRSVEKRDDTKGGDEAKRPQLSDLRESGAIEQDADMVLFIHRPEYYHNYKDAQGKDMRGKAQIIIAKHRNGGVGDVTLNFKGSYARFENEEEQNVPFPESDTNFDSSRMNMDTLGYDEMIPPVAENPFPTSDNDVPF